jgi:hypothetical protein
MGAQILSFTFEVDDDGTVRVDGKPTGDVMTPEERALMVEAFGTTPEDRSMLESLAEAINEGPNPPLLVDVSEDADDFSNYVTRQGR